MNAAAVQIDPSKILLGEVAELRPGVAADDQDREGHARHEQPSRRAAAVAGTGTASSWVSGRSSHLRARLGPPRRRSGVPHRRAVWVKFAFVHVAYVVGLDFWDFCAYAQEAARIPGVSRYPRQEVVLCVPRAHCPSACRVASWRPH